MFVCFFLSGKQTKLEFTHISECPVVLSVLQKFNFRLPFLLTKYKQNHNLSNYDLQFSELK